MGNSDTGINSDSDLKNFELKRKIESDKYSNASNREKVKNQNKLASGSKYPINSDFNLEKSKLDINSIQDLDLEAQISIFKGFSEETRLLVLRIGLNWLKINFGDYVAESKEC